MEFLNALYESEYFVYIVGGAIGILLILFLIILFSGKKKKETDPKEAELLNEVTEKSVIADATPVKDNSLDVTKEFKPEDLAALQTKAKEETVVINTPALEPEAPIYKPVEPVAMNNPVLEQTSQVMEPIKPVIPSVPPKDSLIVNEMEENSYPENVVTTPLVNEEVSPVLETPLSVSKPEEKISFQVTEETELPKLNNEDKEL